MGTLASREDLDEMPQDKGLRRERSGSVVECLTRDRRAAGSSLTGVTALWSLSKTHLSQLSTGSTQEDPSRITERLLSGRKESNKTKDFVRVCTVFYDKKQLLGTELYLNLEILTCGPFKYIN